MATKATCKATFLRYLDEATKKGIAIPSTKNADYVDKFNYFLNEAQIYVSQQIKIPSIYQITQNPITPLSVDGAGFDIKQYLPSKNMYTTSNTLTCVGTKSFYLEIDNIGTITIAINGATTQTINNTVQKVFTPHKYNTGATATDTVTITFSGLYPYNVRNTAMFEYAFPTNADVPTYTPYVEYAMPSDFLEFDNVINKTDPRIYEAYIAYKWENNKKIILPYDDIGSFDIHYFAYPTEILPDANDSTVLTVENKAVDLVVLQAGIMSTVADNPNLSSYLRSLYIEKIQNINVDTYIPQNAVQTVYSI